MGWPPRQEDIDDRLVGTTDPLLGFRPQHLWKGKATHGHTTNRQEVTAGNAITEVLLAIGLTKNCQHNCILTCKRSLRCRWDINAKNSGVVGFKASELASCIIDVLAKIASSKQDVFCPVLPCPQERGETLPSGHPPISPAFSSSPPPSFAMTRLFHPALLAIPVAGLLQAAGQVIGGMKIQICLNRPGRTGPARCMGLPYLVQVHGNACSP